MLDLLRPSDHHRDLLLVHWSKSGTVQRATEAEYKLLCSAVRIYLNSVVWLHWLTMFAKMTSCRLSSLWLPNIRWWQAQLNNGSHVIEPFNCSKAKKSCRKKSDSIHWDSALPKRLLCLQRNDTSKIALLCSNSSLHLSYEFSEMLSLMDVHHSCVSTFSSGLSRRIPTGLLCRSLSRVQV